MLTMLFAVLGGLSPHNSNIRLSVGTSCPGRTSRQASSDRHLAALIAVHPLGDSTSSGPRMRKRIRSARLNARSPPLQGNRKPGDADIARRMSYAMGDLPDP